MTTCGCCPTTSGHCAMTPTRSARVIRAADPQVAMIQEAPRFWRWRSRALRWPGGPGWSGRRRPNQRREPGAVLAGRDVARHPRDCLSPTTAKLHRRGRRWRCSSCPALSSRWPDPPGPGRVRPTDAIWTNWPNLAPTGCRSPADVGGDLNAVPGSATWQRLSGSAPTSSPRWARATASATPQSTGPPDRRPVRRPATAPGSAQVLDCADVRIASDHRPLLAEFDLGKAG